MNSPFIQLLEDLYDSDDFTYYGDVSALGDLLNQAVTGELAEVPARNPRYSPTILATGGVASRGKGPLIRAWQAEHGFRSASPSFSGVLRVIGNNSASVSGRALVCSCYGGATASLTIRSADYDRTNTLAWNPAVAAFTATEYYKPKPASALFPIPLYYVADTLAELVLPLYGARTPAKGLIAVAGETAAAKSDIARSLIHLHLSRCLSRSRRPHLVTLEDPIDALYATLELDGSKKRDSSWKDAPGVDYTPRQVGVDVRNLEDGFHDALRQKPAVLFVGEVRQKQAWRSLLDFAGTGHLVVTTCHAGSLVEAMQNLFEANDAQSAAEMGYVAQRLLAMIHVEPFERWGAKIALPAIWRRTAAGLNGLVNQGLSSVIPPRFSPLAFGGRGSDSCVGRRFFAQQWAHFERQRGAGTPIAPLGAPAPAGGPRGELLTRARLDELERHALALDLRRA